MKQEKLYKNSIYLKSGYVYVFYSSSDVAKQMNIELNKSRKWWDIFRLKQKGMDITYISPSTEESMIIPTKQIIGIRSVLTDVTDLLGDETKKGSISIND